MHTEHLQRTPHRRSHFDPTTTALLTRYGTPPFDFTDSIRPPAQGPEYLEQTVLNALSIPLPQGERFFIATMRDCLTQLQLSPDTQEEVRLFMFQESAHLRQHTAYNKALCEQRGYVLEKLEFAVRFNFDEVNRTRSLHHRLAMTVCLEHITTVLAEAVLRHACWMQQAGASFQRLWNWHALEEIDHRSFAFDLYLAQGHERAYLHQVMRDLVPRQVRFLEAILYAMVNHDGRDPAAAKRWFRGGEFLFQEDGPAPFFAARIDAFYAPAFHPHTHVGFDSLI